MGVIAMIHSPRAESRSLPDPHGGRFEAAGDFDRLLGEREGFPLWSSIDPYEDTVLGASVMPALVEELRQLLGLAREGKERRGLQRLLVMAEHVSKERDSQIVFIGD